ncbi:ribonuclease P protein subunit p38 [Latimeria chalumnae]|uniref:ribonuclease P protein subunit p38 n=1 Tax=Latimeria chalumnae TaxID=7897 RepID=UPI0003C1A499|nr:PREDICTED: ribonuclease P protein subunit p38 [Latimeria chalumnae]XP_005998551.1 PREDICTED: ribonuclease P protein subunit p38 [Latimeria chalumnae]|eukprot:XP_005998550.1 PREDICTED: ribonuclease P protein subunit p38 [Latimeria chalumnae]
MAAATKAGKGTIRKPRPLPVKTTLNNPYRTEWSPLKREVMQFILETLQNKFKEIGLQKVEPPRKRRKHSDENSKKGEKGDSASEVKKENHDKNGKDDKGKDAEEKNKQQGWTDGESRKQLAIGINEVTRALERDELCLVLVCKSIKPVLMCTHLIPLSASRAVPACQVPRLSENLAPLLGLKSVLALGFRRYSAMFAEQVKAITPHVPALHVSWLHCGTRGESAEAQDPTEAREEKMETEEPSEASEENVEMEDDSFLDAQEETEKKENLSADEGSSKNLKRKFSKSVPKINVSKSCDITLQSLKIKKLVPNPDKIRKWKKRKQKK